MRSFLAVLALLVVLHAEATAQSCTNLCLQQVSCAANQTTSITGTVYAPNGTDPLPDVTVYIPNAPVPAFTPGVSCPAVGAPPPGSPLVGTTTAVDGTFELDNVPVGTNIPLVIVAGRWRRQLVVPTTTSCANTALPQNSAVFPSMHSQGDIPLIAISTGLEDQVECVLRKVGIADSEFTDPGGIGRINLYAGANAAGAVIDPATPSSSTLTSSSTALNAYDVLMLPCQGGEFVQPPGDLANFIGFANAGGRVYSSHFSYVWMYNNPPFTQVVNWAPGQNYPTPDPGMATINTSFSEGATLAQWLALPAINASTTPGQIEISTLRKDFNGVNSPTQAWLSLNDTNAGNPVMQFVFDAPIGAANQCGRVLFNEYHVENPPANTSPAGKFFPAECPATAMTPQEKLLEYSLFELTNDGGQPSLAPLSADFGTEAVGFTTAAQTFTWTNNSSFASTVKSAVTTGDFSVTANTCGSVAAGTSCTIAVAFAPTALGARTGVLTVVSAGNTQTATLTGTGVPGLTVAPSTLTFGSLDAGASATQNLTLTNNAPGALPVPVFVTTGDYAVAATACGSSLAAGASCTMTVTFKPTTTGTRSGTVNANASTVIYGGLPVVLTGNGIDFTIALSPTAGSVVAGLGVSTTATISPLAGYAATVTITCASGAAGSACVLASGSLTPEAAAVSTTMSLTTTSQYTVVGYGAMGLVGWMSGGLLWWKRRKLGGLARYGLAALLLMAICGGIGGCSGKAPGQNQVYTAPGTYSYTVTATDGFLVHSASYSLTVKTQ